MAQVKYSDGIRESTTTEGTGDITLAGADQGFFAIADAPEISDGDRVAYAIWSKADADLKEMGIGTYSAGPPATLARNTVDRSSNANAKVDLPAGTKFVSIVPLARSLQLPASGKWLSAGADGQIVGNDAPVSAGGQVDLGNIGGTVSIDMSDNQSKKAEITSNITSMTISANPTTPLNFVLDFQSASGSDISDWFALANDDPVWNAVAGEHRIFGFRWTGSEYFLLWQT